MAGLADFFSQIPARLGGALLPGAYLQGQGITPDNVPGLQASALRQFGLGLLGTVGTRAPVGVRLGQALQGAQSGGEQQIRQIVKEQGDQAAEARLAAQDKTQAAQFAAQQTLRESEFAAQKDQFKQTYAQTQKQLEDASAHATAMEGIARTSGSAQAAAAFSEANIRKQQLEQTVASQKAIQAILDEPGGLTDDKIKRIQVQNLKFSGGAFTPPSLAQQIAQAFGGNGLGVQPGTNPPGSMPTTQQILAAGQR